MSDERRDFMSRKGKYVTGIAKRIQSENPHIQWVEALRRGQTQWNQEYLPKKEEPKPEEKLQESEKPFPEFKTANAQILKSMVKNFIYQKGKMEYHECSYPLAIDTHSKWKDFCSEFMAKAKEIADCFSVENKFRMGIYSGEIAIHYD